MSRFSFTKSPIAHRFILYIVLFSSLITLIITASQLYRDYNNDISLIEYELERIETVHKGSLSAALWASNSKLLQTTIDGVLQNRDIQYIEVRDKQKIWAQAGAIKGIAEENIERNYVMTYQHRNKDINIGTLTVNVSLNGVYQRLYDKVLLILVSNAIKTSLVALFISFLFYQFVARHLFTIVKFLEEHKPLSKSKPLQLVRSNKKKDEFDDVVDSINDMHKRLNEQVVEINEQKQHLFQTLNSIGDAVITTDKNGKVTALNPVAEKLTGWSDKEAKGQALNVIFPIINGTTRKSIDNPIDKVLLTGETVHLSNHTTLISKDGTEYQISDSAAPILDGSEVLGMVLVFNDVTEEYKVRQELKDSHELLEKITAHVPGMVYQFVLDDDGNMSFPYMSKAVQGLYHLSAEEVLEDVSRVFSQTHPDDVEKLNDSIMESARNFTPWKLEYRICTEDGDIRWLYGDSKPEKLPEGGLLWHGFVTDITAKKETEETLRRTQKMDALGKLTGGIAHDYNNMLGVILGFSELLSDEVKGQPTLVEYIEQITHAGRRGAKLTNKLLSFSRNRVSDFEKLDINTVLQEELHMLEKTLTARIQLEIKPEKNLWPVHLDGSELEDAVLNICINAMHAIVSNGSIVIETSNKSLSFTESEGLGVKVGDYVQLKIIDSGCGMDTYTKEKIFDPFYSTKGNNGTGLGLSQVYGFVSRSGGAISVESKLDNGSEFTLYFPRYFGEEDKKEFSESDENIKSKKQEKILVVDDEPSLLILACEVLNQQGYQTLVADSAEKALVILETEQVDLLLSDVIMPNMGGYELASIVQEKYPEIKIQLVSGYTGSENNEDMESELFVNLLSKPYKTEDLLSRIRVLL